ncbi:MAG: aminotransferase class I/II-fold pyridoxal phosphate-dependent enzyme [Clostridia bacterium]|nr:aminotransferase class I/II-fold pyridoxal phosphate-dependent enzyme [Clostridia bacterium]
MQDQRKAPVFEALKKHKSDRYVHFDVPSHKGGRGNPELAALLGWDCMRVDVNSMKPLDNLCHPTSVIREAEILAAEAFGAKNAFLMVGGTTSAVQAMIMSVCKHGDKIILPRNVHRSAINALVICGALPVYINPGINKKLGISLGMTYEALEEAIRRNPDAKAVLFNNPTYYGVCSDLKRLVALAREHGMKTLVDEAHGTHFYFGDNLPVSAMAAGADLSSVSMHKTGGSLTQSSFLLCGEEADVNYIRQIINLTQTTSGSYLLMSSLDVARRNLALNGKSVFAKTLELTEYARAEINKIGGYYAYASEICDGGAAYAFDRTKLSIHTREMGLAGIEVYDILRDDYSIQIEFGDLGNILAIISSGDRMLEIERLVAALGEIKRLYGKSPVGMMEQEYLAPDPVMSPQASFYSDKKTLPVKESEGEVSAEFVMCYPPGIPVLAPGERITKDIIEYIEYAKEKGCLVTGPHDMEINNIKVVKK